MGYTLYLTNDCNLRCKYCYEGNNKKNTYLSNTILERTLDYIVKLAGDDEKINLVLLGGEPLMNKKVFFKLFDLINTKYIFYKDKFQFEMTTNGILLDEEIMDIIQLYNIELSISIDGDRYSHNINRSSINGKDMFDVIIENIKKLIERKIEFKARMTVSQNNIKYLLSNLEYLMNLGIHKFGIAFNDFEKWDDVHLQFMEEQIYNVARYYLVKIQIYDDLIIDLFDYKIGTYLVKRGKQQYCCAGRKRHFVVDSMGDIYPCGYVVGDRKWNIGNVYDGIDEKKFIESVNTSIYNNNTCKSCDIQFACIVARCGFLNYSLTGYLTKGSDSTCKLERILDKYVRYVIRELYKMNSDRLIGIYNKVIEQGLELSDYMKEIIEKEKK